MLCFPKVLLLRCLGKSAPKNGRAQRIGCGRCRRNLHHACARERFGNQNQQRLAGSEHFLKFKSAKFAPHRCTSAIWKPKSFKTERIGRLFEVQVRKVCTTLWREGDSEAKAVKNTRPQGLRPFFDVQSVFRVASVGISTERPYKNR